MAADDSLVRTPHGIRSTTTRREETAAEVGRRSDAYFLPFGSAPKVNLRPPGHQFQSPKTRMVAGTRRIRTIVASTNTATARPRPMALVRTMPVRAKAPVTTMIMAAAEGMIPAVATSPLETLAGFESPFS